MEDQVLKLEELGPVLKQLNDVEKQVTAIQIDKRLSNKRQQGHNDSNLISLSKIDVSANDSWFLYSALIETLVFCFLAFFQIYYLKHLLEKRRGF